MTTDSRMRVLPCVGLLLLAAGPARAELFSMSASGTISFSTDMTIAVGTPWEFEVIYETSAPDLDSELTGVPDPSFGRYANTGGTPALTRFHYRAGTYEVTLDDPADFGPFSAIDITFGGVHAIDINLNAPDLFPPLAGGAVSFHADFNDSSKTTLTSDALPTNTAVGVQNFQDASATLLPSNGVVLGSLSDMTSVKIAAVPNRDSDLIADAYDLCPDYPSPDNADSDGNGIGDECECGDQTQDGTVNVRDLLGINLAIFGTIEKSPLCDTNDDGRCDVQDLVGANNKIFGVAAYCSRYPPPGP